MFLLYITAKADSYYRLARVLMKLSYGIHSIMMVVFEDVSGCHASYVRGVVIANYILWPCACIYAKRSLECVDFTGYLNPLSY